MHKDEVALFILDGGGAMSLSSADEALTTLKNKGAIDFEGQKGRWELLLQVDIIPYILALEHAERQAMSEDTDLSDTRRQAGRYARLIRESGFFDHPAPVLKDPSMVKNARGNNHPLSTPPIISDYERIKQFVDKYSKY
jgi:hypothetical protein